MYAIAKYLTPEGAMAATTATYRESRETDTALTSHSACPLGVALRAMGHANAPACPRASDATRALGDGRGEERDRAVFVAAAEFIADWDMHVLMPDGLFGALGVRR